MNARRTASVLDALDGVAADAVYSDGVRLRLGPVRLVRFKRARGTWVQWGGVRIIRPGRIDSLALDQMSLGIPPEDVRPDMTYSVSVPLPEVMRALEWTVRDDLRVA